jgi:hypothetical protein
VPDGSESGGRSPEEPDASQSSGGRSPEEPGTGNGSPGSKETGAGDGGSEEPRAGGLGSEETGAGGGVSWEPAEIEVAGGWPEDPQAWESGRRAPSPEEALRRLEERLDRASEAAERLMAEAAAEAASAGARPQPPPSSQEPPPSSAKPPPAGWQVREDGAPAPSRDFEPLLQLLQALRDLIPPELQRRLAAAIRELLLALRALIDWYLDRFDQRHKGPVDVQDIPIL